MKFQKVSCSPILAVMLVFRATAPEVYQDILAIAGAVFSRFCIGPRIRPKHCGSAGIVWVWRWLWWLRRVSILPASILLVRRASATRRFVPVSPVGTNFHRFANCSDVVTQVPLEDILDFQHAGTPQYFDVAGNLHTQPDGEFVKSDQFKARWQYPLLVRPVPFPLFRDLADHAIVNCFFGIWKNLNL